MQNSLGQSDNFIIKLSVLIKILRISRFFFKGFYLKEPYYQRIQRFPKTVFFQSLTRAASYLQHTEKMKVLVTQSCPTLQPHGLQPTRFLCLWNSPGKNTGVGSHALLQGIFPNQGSKLGLLHCWWILCSLSRQGSPEQLDIHLLKVNLDSDPTLSSKIT